MENKLSSIIKKFLSFTLKSKKKMFANFLLLYNERFFEKHKMNKKFLEKRDKVATLQKSSPYIGFSYKLVLKSDKSLNRILTHSE